MLSKSSLDLISFQKLKGGSVFIAWETLLPLVGDSIHAACLFGGEEGEREGSVYLCIFFPYGKKSASDTFFITYSAKEGGRLGLAN